MCGDSDVGEYDGKVAEVDWKRAVDCLHKQNVRCSVKECVSIGSTALRAGCVFKVTWYVLVAVCLSWKGLTSLLTTAMLASTVATLGNLIPCALRIRWLL